MAMNVAIRQAELSDPQILHLMQKLDAYQTALYPAESNHLDSPQELMQPSVYFVGAFVDNYAVGIGAVKVHAVSGNAEIKRVYVDRDCRGHGISKQIMNALEEHARGQGCRLLMLETGVYQKEAIKLYECLGFCYRTAFGDYPRDDPYSVFMEKPLA